MRWILCSLVLFALGGCKTYRGTDSGFQIDVLDTDVDTGDAS